MEDIKRGSDLSSSGRNLMDRRVTMSLVAIVLFLSCIFSVSVVDAERFNIEMTLEAGEHFEIHKALTNGSRIVGSYSKTLSVSDFFFFICNSTNFLE